MIGKISKIGCYFLGTDAVVVSVMLADKINYVQVSLHRSSRWTAGISMNALMHVCSELMGRDCLILNSWQCLIRQFLLYSNFG